MKLIITEEQYRLLIENEDGKNLIDLTSFENLKPSALDDMFLHINKKKGGKYDGYYIDGDLDLYKIEADDTTLDYLVKVGGNLYLANTKIESLPRLTEVGGFLNITKTKIKSLPMLSSVGGYLALLFTPLSNKISKEELEKQINVGREIYL